MKMLLFLLCAVLLLSGCAASTGADTVTESPMSISGSSESFHSVYFPDCEEMICSHENNSDGTVFLSEIIKTNTTQIAVKNIGDISFDCNLYYPDDPDDVIQTFTLEPGNKKTFTGLTSRYTYCLSFHSEETGTVEAKVTG